jgi:DNA-directed RNA polymerase subunit beta'
MTQKYTTAGSLLIKHSLPTEAAKAHYDPYKSLDKGGVSNLVNMILKYGGPGAGETINDLAKQFFNVATDIGATTPLSDYINDSEERTTLIDEFDFKAQKILNTTKSQAEKDKDLLSLITEYENKVQKQNLAYLVSKGSVAAKMAQTGARGNPKQLAAGTATPLISNNLSGEIVPVVIKHSFAEGMTPAEQTALSYMGRGNSVLTQLATSKPGALFKRLGPTVYHEVITITDCGTKNGINIPISDKKSIIGRYEAETNRLISDQYYKECVQSSRKFVKCRSAMTCEAHDGICVKCFGLMGNGLPPEIGENVGVIAAQSISEVLTQSILSTKHKASVGERKGNAYEQASNLMRNPTENFQDEATLAQHNGKITHISTTALGDHNVYVKDTAHFVPQAQTLNVAVGDEVKTGEALSSGVINPRKLVQLRGLGAGRRYMANELREIYGGGLDPRHFEIVAKNLLKYVQVEDPGQTGFMPGQVVSVGEAEKFLRTGTKEIPVGSAEGAVLAKGVHELTPGTLLDANHIEELEHKGVKTVKVTGSGLTVTPIVPGLESAKNYDSNWVSRLAFTRLKDTITDSAAVGDSSDIHSTDPVPSYIIGREFGEGENGAY